MRRNPSYEGHQRALDLSTRGTYLGVSDCRTCGEAIAWASSRSGKKYPCEVVVKMSEEFGFDHDVLRATPWIAHKCKAQVAEPV